MMERDGVFWSDDKLSVLSRFVNLKASVLIRLLAA